MSEPMLAVLGEKAVLDDEGHVSGWLAPFGGPVKGRDLEGEYFTKDTDFALDYYPATPILFRHGRHPDVGRAKIGTVSVKEIRDKGLFVEGELDRQSVYYDALRELAARGDLYWSSGSNPNWVKKDAKSGEIKDWPIIEATLTTTPMNPDAAAYLKEALLVVAEKGWLPEGTTPGDLDDGDFAWISEDGKTRKLPYKIHGKVNEAGWRAAWDRAHQAGTDFSGGPSQADVIAKLKRDKPEGIETAADEPDNDADDKELAEPVKEGRRNSTSDQQIIQTMHDHAVALGAMCSDTDDDGKSLETPPAPVLAIAGNSVERPTEEDLAAVKSMLRDVAVAEARRYLGRG